MASPLLLQQPYGLDVETRSWWESEKVRTTAKIGTPIACGLTTIGFIALSIIQNYGTVINCLITFPAGLFFQTTLLAIPRRYTEGNITFYGKAIDFQKDKLLKYAAVFFIALTNLYLNLHHPMWLVLSVFGIFNFVYAMQIAAQVDNFIHSKLKDSRIPDRLEESVPLVNVSSVETQPTELPTLSYEKTIRLYPPNKVELNAEADEDRARLKSEMIKLGFFLAAMTALLLTRKYLSDSSNIDLESAGLTPEIVHQAFAFPLKYSYISIGKPLGGLFFEWIHTKTKNRQKENEVIVEQSEYGSPVFYTPKPVQQMMAIEKILWIVGILFTGSIIAANTVGTDILSGFLMGIVSQIAVIDFTQTHMTQHHRLKKKKEETQTLAMKIYEWSCFIFQWVFAIGAVAWWVTYNLRTLGLEAYNLYPVCTFPAVLFPAYFFGRYIDSKKIDEKSSPFLNWLFFKAHYFISAPITYIAVDQTLPLNDVSLQSYPGYVAAVASIGVGSLALNFGLESARQATKRDVTYPAEISSLIILFSFFLCKSTFWINLSLLK